MKAARFEPLDPAVYLEIVRRALAEDLGWGDLTTDATVSSSLPARATVTSESWCVVAGGDVAAETFRQLDPVVSILAHVPDGEVCEAGAPVLTLDGSASALLTAGRTALNFLERLSAIATLTRRYVDVAAQRATILDSRSTTPLLRALEQYAVRAGGAANHRGALDSGILIERHHVALAGTVTEAITRMRRAGHDLPIQVEVESATAADEALGAGATRLLVTSRALDAVREIVSRARGRAQVEVSGDGPPDRLPALLDTGADFISISALTHAPAPVTFSFTLSRVDAPVADG